MSEHRPNRHSPLRALLVDDDPEVRSVIKDSLETLGFEVLEASNGFQAIQLVLLENPDFHIAVSDFRMPKMNGVETLTALRALRPGLKSILCSGNTEWECLHGQTLQDCVYLGKPFGINDLDAAVNLALG